MSVEGLEGKGRNQAAPPIGLGHEQSFEGDRFGLTVFIVRSLEIREISTPTST